MKNDSVKNTAQIKDPINPGSGGGRSFSVNTVATVRLKGEKSKNFGATVKRILSLLGPDRGRIAAALALAAVSTAFAVASPMLLARITTALQHSVMDGEPFDLAMVPRIMLVLGILYGLSFVFERLWRTAMVKSAQRMIYGLRKQVDKKLSRLPLRFFDGTRTGDVMSRATNDIDNLAALIQTSLGEFVAAAVTVVGTAAVMLYIDPLITLICVVTIPMGTLITMAIVRGSHRYFREQASLMGELNTQVEEACTGHRIIKAFSEEKMRSDTYGETSERYRAAASRAQYASGFTYPLTALVNELSYIAICLVGGLKVISGTMTLGNVQALVHYSQRLSNPVTTISNMMSVVQTAVSSAERVFELLDEPETEKDGDRTLDVPVKGEVRFDDVSFSYDPEKPLIEHFSLRADPGQCIAIVGHTGAGKTTLVNLLMRFYRPDSGVISIDGTDISQLTAKSLYGTVAMVLQDTWLFHGTIAENIAYGARDPGAVTREEIISAAKTAMAHRFIASLPDGYDTVVGDE